MFVTLLLATLAIATLISLVVAQIFARPIRKILGRLVGKELAPAWTRYVRFAVIVVGISGGVRLGTLERYLSAGPAGGDPLVLDGDRWVLEVYATVIGSLQSIAWVLLVVFLFALVAYVVVRGFEVRRGKGASEEATP